MPQATNELRERMRERMRERFGDPIDDRGPRQYLFDRGYTQRRDWTWNLPRPNHEPTAEERECLQFLIDEWDEGGLTDVR